MYGPSASRSSAPITGMFTAFVTRPPSSAASDLLGDDHARAVLRLVGGGGEVRRHDDIVELEQRTRVRLRREDVERGARDLAGLQRGDERVLVDELAAGGVDRGARRRASCANAAASIERARLRRERRVQREELRRRVDVVGRLDALDAELAEPLDGDERVERDDAHAETERAARDLLADAPEAEHAERLAGELDAAVLLALPAALLQRGVRLRDVARERDEQPDRVLGRRDDGRLGRVRDDDAAPRRRLDVDVVDSDARAADHLQAASHGSISSAVSFVAERTTIAS